MPPNAPEPKNLSDSDLLRSLRDGDPNALGRLLDLLWAPLVRYATRILSDDVEAQDVVQEALVRLWARRDRLREDGSLKALLYTTVRNACLDELRTARRRKGLRATEHQPPAPRTPYEDVHGAELLRLAAAAVASLPQKRQEVFRLIREEGLSYRETAETLGLSEQTVANHMSLALADLRTTIRPYLTDRPTSSENDRDSRPRTGPRSG